MAGITENGTIKVKLLGSKNEYLSYPVNGLLTITETGTDGSIIQATFRTEGGCPVRADRPVFIYE
jgi:hypothetical protein